MIGNCFVCGTSLPEGKTICHTCVHTQHKSILVFDPGESTGWVFRDVAGNLTGGTAPKDHTEVAQLIETYGPNIVVLERFNLYPGMAKSLSWNSFYPCEVIGVIRYMCAILNIPVVEQAPSVKKFFGGFHQDWTDMQGQKPTEHTKDAYMHYRYFLLNGAKKFTD